MKFFGTKKEVIIVLDINDVSVSGGVVRVEDTNNTRTILLSTQEQIKYEHKKESAVAALEIAVQKVVEKLAQSAHSAKSKRVHILVHAPWITSQSQFFSSELPHETTITEKILGKFIEHNTKHDTPEDSVQIDKNITRAELNGYTTQQPLGKRATTIGASILSSLMSKKVHAALKRATAHAFPNHEIVFDAFVLGILRAPELFRHEWSFSFLDIGGDRATLISVENNAITAVEPIEFGSQMPLRAIAKCCATPTQATPTLLSLYLNNTCTPSQCQKIAQGLKKPEAEWIKQFGDTCASATKVQRLPTTLFINTDTKVFPWFKKISERLDFAQFTAGTQPFSVYNISHPENISVKTPTNTNSLPLLSAALAHSG